MKSRWMAVVLGAAMLAVPGTALAKGDHGKGHHKDKAAKHQKAEKHGKSHGKSHGKKDKAAKKGKTYVFKGVYKADGVVTVSGGNSRVRKGGYVGQDVTFDLSKAKIAAADSDGVAGVTAADVKAGDLVLVQARLPRGTKAPEAPVEAAASEEPAGEDAPAALVARKLVVLSRPASADDDDSPEQPEQESEKD